MAVRITNQQILSTTQNPNNVSFKEMILDLKPDPKTGKTTKRIRLIGEAIGYTEYNPRIKNYNKLDAKGKPTIEQKPFPDAHLKKAITRIGHDDPEQCDWNKLGYIGSKKYAQNCLEYMPDGTYVPRVLNKGAQVFKPLAEWEDSKVQEREEEGEDSVPCTFLGGRTAYEVNVTCVKDDNAPGGVRYSASPRSKLVEITDEDIEALKAVFAPSDEDMKVYRKEYNERRASDPRLPEFEDFFEYGFNLRNIFKYTPILTEEQMKEKEDDLDKMSKPAPTPTKKTVTKTAKVAEDPEEEEDENLIAAGAKTAPNMFKDLDEEEDSDDWSI